MRRWIDRGSFGRLLWREARAPSPVKEIRRARKTAGFKGQKTRTPPATSRQGHACRVASRLSSERYSKGSRAPSHPSINATESHGVLLKISQTARPIEAKNSGVRVAQVGVGGFCRKYEHNERVRAQRKRFAPGAYPGQENSSPKTARTRESESSLIEH